LRSLDAGSPHQVRQAHRDRLALPVHKAHKGLPEHKAHKDLLELPEHQAHKGRQVPPDLRARREIRPRLCGS
jgi:hypothetical protein